MDWGLCANERLINDRHIAVIKRSRISSELSVIDALV